ncbi:MAG: alkaline phosphatase family protein [Bryobacteraceae bacterium]
MTRRDFLSSSSTAVALAAADSLLAAPGRKTRNLILVTSDGLRWQDLFNGIDPLLMKEKSTGMGDSAGASRRERLWKPQAEERRLVLMPFFWGTLATQGVVLGNVQKGSSVQVTNRYRVSYPGYSEIMTGRAQDETIRGNDAVQNPTPSFLQFVREQWKLPKEKVAVFGSWDMFHYICENRRGEIYINAGYEESALPEADQQVALINKLQMQARYIDDSARHDAFTFGLAFEYLRNVQPRLLYVTFDETDDWAHSRRYDCVLDSIQFVDASLRQLWEWVQNSPTYRDSTTLIVTCDHGRGSTVEDWHSHGEEVHGAEQIWIATAGPDTPAIGEVTGGPEWHQRDIAPTALELLGVDGANYAGMLGKPIATALK